MKGVLSELIIKLRSVQSTDDLVLESYEKFFTPPPFPLWSLTLDSHRYVT